jgi:predicted SprT family Zn-dependent metalloprotease
MQPLDAQSLALSLLRHHGLNDWTFTWNRRKRSLGLCRYHEKTIQLSVYFVRDNGIEAVRETILHEIAHALAGQPAGHGPAWKAVCRKIGCLPVRCDNGSAIMPFGRWRAECPACGKQYSRHRRPQRKAQYWCRNCGPEKGPVQFAIAS